MIKLQIFRDDRNVLGSGLPLQLLVDGNVVDKAITDADGVVVFKVDVSNVQRLALRIDQETLIAHESSAGAQPSSDAQPPA